MGLPLKNMSLLMEKTGLALKNFLKIKASPIKNSISFYSTPKEILRSKNVPLKRAAGVGRTDIKCNSPI